MTRTLTARYREYQRIEIANLERSVAIFRGLAEKYERKLAEVRAANERSEREC